MQDKQKAKELIQGFKGSNYAFGLDVLDKVGEFAAQLGKRGMLVAAERDADWMRPILDKIRASLNKNGVNIGRWVIMGARPNAPREDVYRIEGHILHREPDCLIAVGGGSSIDAVKAADVLASLGEESAEIEDYFGVGKVTEVIQRTGKKLIPIVAVQTAASSGAHLTKYSNVTDPLVGQKKLIVDDAIIPPYAVFDYGITASAPWSLTSDGAMDGIAHSLEVFIGHKGEDYALIEEVATLSIRLIVENLPRVMENPGDIEAREALGLGTDLGGYAIMIGGTNGGHLTSFSLVDILAHGRACAIMNPYYTVFFAPAIEKQLQAVGEIYRESGYISTNLKNLRGRDLGLAVAEGMIAFAKRVGFVTKLDDVPGMTDAHIERALTAAKNPQLEMKLKNMPIPLSAALVDEYMAPILWAAKTGDFSVIEDYVPQ